MRCVNRVVTLTDPAGGPLDGPLRGQFPVSDSPRRLRRIRGAVNRPNMGLAGGAVSGVRSSGTSAQAASPPRSGAVGSALARPRARSLRRHGSRLFLGSCQGGSRRVVGPRRPLRTILDRSDRTQRSARPSALVFGYRIVGKSGPMPCLCQTATLRGGRKPAPKGPTARVRTARGAAPVIRLVPPEP